MKTEELAELLGNIARELNVTIEFGVSHTAVDAALVEDGPDGAQVFWYHRKVTYPEPPRQHGRSRWTWFLLGVHEVVHAAWPWHPQEYVEDLSFFGVEWRLTKIAAPPMRALRGMYDGQVIVPHHELKRLRERHTIPASCTWLDDTSDELELHELSSEQLLRLLTCAGDVATEHGYLSKLGTFSPLLRREPIDLQQESLIRYRFLHKPLRKRTAKQE